jgi:hypothetical protein
MFIDTESMQFKELKDLVVEQVQVYVCRKALIEDL